MKKRIAFLSPLALAAILVLAGLFVEHTSASRPDANRLSHTSMYYYDNQSFFADSLKPFASTTPTAPAPRIFITNQHVLAASLIAHQFALARDPSVTNVVLMTQNNWNAGTAPIITSEENWQTPLGNIALDSVLTEDLVGKHLATVDEDVFIHEHGITGIIPYVAYAFPNAKVTVLVIRDKTPDNILDTLAAELEAKQNANTVIVGTIDMSHYLPKYLSDEHDAKTIESISHFDYAALPKLDIDTAPTLRVVMKTAEHLGEENFTVTGHTNSADITDQPDLLSTTSYITGYFSKGAAAASPEPVNILFTGDVMLDRNVAAHAKASGDDALFSQVERMFLGTDAVVINHEGTETTEPSVASIDKLQFTFDPHFAAVLAELGVSVATLSNNHTFDFGEAGYESTKANLANAGIATFGSPHNDDELSTSITVHGKKVCFVGYEEFVRPDTAPFVAEIQRLRPSCDLVVATMHAGVEYQPDYTTHQELVAHAFIDAGADMVIGTHPHVVEPLEIYKGKAIFYSLGNFMFDQNWSFATTHGLAVQVAWDGTSTRFTLVPVTIKGEEVSFPDATNRINTLRALVAPSVNSALPEAVASAILNTYTFTLN